MSWPRTAHYSLLLPQAFTVGDFSTVVESVVGPQIEDIARANASSVLLYPASPVSKGDLAHLTSAATSGSEWAKATIVAANAGLAGQTRMVFAGITTLSTNGTAGYWCTPGSATGAVKLEGGALDDANVLGELLITRRPLGFSLGGSVMIAGPAPLTVIKNMRIGEAVTQGAMTLGQQGFSGTLGAAATSDVVWQVFIPADFGTWHLGQLEASMAAQLRITVTGTVTAKLRMIDTLGVASGFETPNNQRPFFLGVDAVDPSLTFTPGRIAFLCARFDGGAAGGNASCDRYPIVRYDSWTRSNA